MRCPCCQGKLIYNSYNDIGNSSSTDTHAWICTDCPIVMFEYYTTDDIDNLKKI